jgi:hypothetical protein
MSDHTGCRLVVRGEKVELAGPPAALRVLAELLRRHEGPFEVAITDGTVAQEVTEGLLLVRLQSGTRLRFCGSTENVSSIWDALDGVADQAETAVDRGVNRHAHIETLPDDEYRSPDSVPFVITADWPDSPVRTGK